MLRVYFPDEFMSVSAPPAKSLRTQIALVFGSFTALLSIVLCLLCGEILKLRLQQQAASNLKMVAQNAATLLHEEIRQQSHRAQVLARSKELWENGLDAHSVRTMLDRVQYINPHNVWIGVADIEGTVRNATQGLLQGSNVAARPWFKEGLTSPFISEVHPAKLLANLLPRSVTGEPLRLMDFSAPIYRPDGSVAGVLGIHGSWDWVRDSVERLLQGQGQHMQQNIFIFDQKGELIYAPAGVMAPYTNLGQHLPLQGADLKAAVAGKPVQTIWKDRAESYLTSAVQLPDAATDLGWWVVARQPLETAYAGANRILWLALAVGLLLGLLGALIAWRLASHVSNDLKALATAAGRIHAGHVETPLPVMNSNREVQLLTASLSHMTQKLLHANEEMQAQVQLRTLELQQANAELQRQATTDPLTHLLNRRGFESRATLAMALAIRNERPLSVLSIDIDFFKRVNDSYGHDVGDAVLQALAHTLSQRARQTDLVARFGGEEFVLLLPDTDGQGAEHMAEQLRESIAAVHIPPVGYITVSVGVSSLYLDHANDSLNDLLKRSDAGLYEAKRKGRNCVVRIS